MELLGNFLKKVTLEFGLFLYGEAEPNGNARKGRECGVLSKR